MRETGCVLEPGLSRERLASVLNAAFAEGLLSEQTFSHRLGLLFGPRLIEPHGVVGDLTLRADPRRRPAWRTLGSAVTAVRAGLARIIGSGDSDPEPLVLALDWTGAQDDLLIGRDPGCDIGLHDATVSRRHARLVFRDSAWVIQDLASKNGVTVNGTHVGRCQLQPGDRVGLGLQLVEID
ncbi:MAG: FHA domain-containing protein [Solirubrobacteraceae bacterium]